MSTIIENFKKQAEERNIVLDETTDEKKVKTNSGKDVTLKQVIFRTTLKLGEHGMVPCSILFQDGDQPQTNYQIAYSSVAQVTDRNELPNILEAFNRLNAVKTGYYHLVISQDGQVSLRHVGMTGEDVRPVVDTFVFAGKLIGALLDDLKAIKGLAVLPATPKKDE